MSLLFWGSNQSGQLAGQTGKYCYTPAEAKDGQLEEQVPIQVTAGYEHTLVLCESGDVFAVGANRTNSDPRNKVGSNVVKVPGLDHETVVHVAAGAHSSYAVTNGGRVYQWGLIHADVPNDDESASAASTTSPSDVGLVGLAADQSTVVTVDAESRNASHRPSRGAAGNRQSDRARQLREIVRDSTEQWMLPTYDAEQEYYEELRSMGYALEEAEEKMQERGREYHGMLRMGCRRVPEYIPRLIPLDGIRIVSVSAGYAHATLISDKGYLFAAGYNDRGQLGLGHRINTSVFKPVDFLSSKFVLEVSCGQQHTLCRAVDRALFDSNLAVGSLFPADVYSWGNGMLGQLGLGLRGSSKGRLFPTLIPYFYENHPSMTISIGAGANFSAVCIQTGEVFSFGHAEYNQHGTGSTANQDYVDPYYFFVPRLVPILEATTPLATPTQVLIQRISCGSMFTIATSVAGDLYSWGWNEGGVLGHGVSYFSASPKRIDKIGMSGESASSNGGRIQQVVCGAKHVIALKAAAGMPWLSFYRQLLTSGEYCDLKFLTDEPSLSVKGINKGAVQAVFHAHRAIVAARSPYLRGLIDAAIKHSDESSSSSQLALTLHGYHFNTVTMKALLEYLYLDRVHILPHKRREMMQVAVDLHLPDLENSLIDDYYSEKEAKKKGESMSSDRNNEFLQNILTMVGSKRHADVVFVVPKVEGMLLPNEKAEFNSEFYESHIFAHKFLVQRVPYFATLFQAPHFRDCNTFASLPAPENVWGRTEEGKEQRVQVVNVAPLLSDGASFATVLLHVYTGQLQADQKEEEEESEEMNEIMAMLVLSNRLGFTPLAQYCERRISLGIAFSSVEEVEHCYQFAEFYNLPRLEMQCKTFLAHNGGSHHVFHYLGGDSSEIERGGRNEKAAFILLVDAILKLVRYLLP